MCRKYFIKYLTEDFVTFRCIIATNSFLGLDTEHAFTVFWGQYRKYFLCSSLYIRWKLQAISQVY